ncbi:MAG: hypothetical protein ABSF34_12455 [Verrucomicrobiota bacterium]
MGENVPVDGLRLEVNPESFYLLSYHHLEFGKFESGKDRDVLALAFTGHQVRIVGRNLRELAVALQKRAVEAIIPMPNRYSAAASAQGGLVEVIEVQAKIGNT